MKKKLLFVIPNLEIGGAEKSLVTLLNAFDFNIYEVDLLLLSKKNTLIKYLPQNVHVIFPSTNYFIFSKNIIKSIWAFISKGDFSFVFNRLLYSITHFLYRKNLNKGEQYAFVFLKATFEDLKVKKYDAAIGFLEKTSIYIVTDCITASKKFGFIRTDYAKLKTDVLFDVKYFSKLDYLCANGDTSADVLRSYFPDLVPNIKVIKNTISPKELYVLAQEPITENIPEQIIILSIGRLIDIKGFDLAVEAAAILKSKGFLFTWLIIGEGIEKDNLQSDINRLKLKESFLLLGKKENPYPYLNKTDIYVQTSRFEGKSSTINEAKIFNKPIVSTDFDSVFEQISNEENGLICNLNAGSISAAIERIIIDKKLTQYLINNLNKEVLDTGEEIEKLYELINE